MTAKTKRSVIVVAIAVVLLASVAFAGSMIGKLYIKQTEVLLTERSGLACLIDSDNYCERTYRCPDGKVAHALMYNIKENQGKKQLAGLSLVCSDPNAFEEPFYVGAAGDAFAGTVINDYCPVGYLLAGADFYTNDRNSLTGARRVCRRYNPRDERRGANIYGEGFDHMANACPPNHWVSGIKISFSHKIPEGGQIDSNLINARFYCSEIRHYLVEPDTDEEQMGGR